MGRITSEVCIRFLAHTWNLACDRNLRALLETVENGFMSLAIIEAICLSCLSSFFSFVVWPLYNFCYKGMYLASLSWGTNHARHGRDTLSDSCTSLSFVDNKSRQPHFIWPFKFEVFEAILYSLLHHVHFTNPGAASLTRLPLIGTLGFGIITGAQGLKLKTMDDFKILQSFTEPFTLPKNKI